MTNHHCVPVATLEALSDGEPWAVVLGGGGITGGAWSLGVLKALKEQWQVDLTQANALYATSAGSIIAALISCGVDLEELYRAQFQRDHHLRRKIADLPNGPRPKGPMPGNLRLAWPRWMTEEVPYGVRLAGLLPPGTASLKPVGDVVADHYNSQWPQAPALNVCAVNYESGKRRIFNAMDSDSVSLPEAIMASCAIPSVFEPQLIDSERYVDGGMWSNTNADAAVESKARRVLVLSPQTISGDLAELSGSMRLVMKMRQRQSAALERELALLRGSGAEVMVIAPSAEEHQHMGPNSMDERRRSSSAALGYAYAREHSIAWTFDASVTHANARIGSIQNRSE